ncbi:helix-turn-helix domain-containing protein [Actinoplanes sp. NPDC023936]|uniref:helix-turn-helix domain-containing protein n=1 Tax=Actinoplanes sp. NPDC023936 TaxID=3154910 RepID=UPI0034041162
MIGCDDCRTTSAARNRNRTRLIAYGQWQGLVDIEPVRQHLKSLTSGTAGRTMRDIARTANVSPSVVDRILTGKQPTLRSATAKALLGVPLTPTPSSRVSSLGTARRLQALMAAGWDAQPLADRLGVNVQQVRKWRYRYQERITYLRHQAIAALYRELECRTGPSEPARIQARTLGYAPPVCWDDDGDLDDVRGRPKSFKKRHNHPTPIKEKAA